MPVRDTAPLSLTLTLKLLGRRELDSVRVVETMSVKVFEMRAAWGCSKGVSVMAKKRHKARGRKEAAIEGSPTGLASSVAMAFFPFLPLDGRPEPAAWA